MHEYAIAVPVFPCRQKSLAGVNRRIIKNHHAGLFGFGVMFGITLPKGFKRIDDRLGGNIPFLLIKKAVVLLV